MRGIADLEHAEQVAARIHAVLEAPFAIEPNSITISASIGIAVATDRDEEAADLLLHADGALYDAKRHGGGHSKSATERARTETGRRFNVERDLRDAIENDELQLVYQPIFELASGRAARVEALLRWTHPQLGEIAAPAIVASAERTGLIRDLGGWVIHTACEQLRSWKDVRRRRETASASTSRRAEFIDPSYRETVEASARRTASSPARSALRSPRVS